MLAIKEPPVACVGVGGRFQLGLIVGAGASYQVRFCITIAGERWMELSPGVSGAVGYGVTIDASYFREIRRKRASIFNILWLHFNNFAVVIGRTWEGVEYSLSSKNGFGGSIGLGAYNGKTISLALPIPLPRDRKLLLDSLKEGEVLSSNDLLNRLQGETFLYLEKKITFSQNLRQVSRCNQKAPSKRCRELIKFREEHPEMSYRDLLSLYYESLTSD